MKERLNVTLNFWGDEEHKLYLDVKRNAINHRISATQYIKQAIAEKIAREATKNNINGDQ